MAYRSADPLKAQPLLSSALDPGIDLRNTYLPPDASDCLQKRSQLSAKKEHFSALVERLSKSDDLLKTSVLGQPGVEKLFQIPPYKESARQLKKKRKMEKEKTKGEKWFNFPATEVTEEIKNDLTVLQMRSALNPKQFYKKNDLKVLPKYFQVGTIEDSPADFYHSRVPMKQRKRTLVEELLADAKFRKRSKKKYAEIKAKQRPSGAHRHMKRLKKKK